MDGTSRTSEVNLVEMSSAAAKEEDTAVLLEGGALQTGPATKARSSTSLPIFKFVNEDPFSLAYCNFESIFA